MRSAGVSAIALAMMVCACAPAEVDEPRVPVASVRSTQFSPPPAPVTDAVPTAQQLTILLAASLDYSIREEDRAHLFDGPSEQNVSIARAWGAQPDPQHIEFTTVEPAGPDAVNASGQGHFGNMGPYPVGPIPFVRWDNEWKVSRSVACGFVGAFESHDACA